MPSSAEQLVQQIHDSPLRLVLAVTGGGSQTVSMLQTAPGASRTLLEAVVPYAATALAEFLDSTPEQACSEATARAMAMTAFLRALQLAPDDYPFYLMGVGCTASLASDRPKRGAHRVHVAVQTARSTSVAYLQFDAEHRTRADEESLTADIILNAIYGAAACLGETSESVLPAGCGLELPTLENEQCRTEEVFEDPQHHPWGDLLLGRCQRIVAPNGGDRPRPPTDVILPGSFNPLHEGHRRMVEVAGRRLDRHAALELSIFNVDKPPLDFLELQRRLEPAGGYPAWELWFKSNHPADKLESAGGYPLWQAYPLWLTRAATFEEKAVLFPGATFLVGADTIARTADPNYYEGNPDRRDAAIDKIVEAGCHFLVFGRVVDGKFQGLAELELPPALRAVCEEVSEDEFRVDLSSTVVRRCNTSDG